MIVHCAYDELVPIKDLKEHPDNNNQHTVEQIERLAKIMDFNGVTSPITVSKRTGYISRGHARKVAAIKLGYEKFPVQYIEYRDEAHEYSDLTADNEIARWAKLDKQAVYEKIEQIEGLDDIELLGIEDFKIEAEVGDVDISDSLGDSNQFVVSVECENEEEMSELYGRLKEEGYTCNLITSA